MEKKRSEKHDNLKIKEENRDLWYERIANRPSMKQEEEPCVTWMEYFDLIDAYKG